MNVSRKFQSYFVISMKVIDDSGTAVDCSATSPISGYSLMKT